MCTCSDFHFVVVIAHLCMVNMYLSYIFLLIWYQIVHTSLRGILRQQCIMLNIFEVTHSGKMNSLKSYYHMNLNHPSMEINRCLVIMFNEILHACWEKTGSEFICEELFRRQSFCDHFLHKILYAL